MNSREATYCTFNKNQRIFTLNCALSLYFCAKRNRTKRHFSPQIMQKLCVTLRAGLHFPVMDFSSWTSSTLNVTGSSKAKQLDFKHTAVISSNIIYSACFAWLIENTFRIQHQPKEEKQDGKSGGPSVESAELLSQTSEYTDRASFITEPPPPSTLEFYHEFGLHPSEQSAWVETGRSRGWTLRRHHHSPSPLLDPSLSPHGSVRIDGEQGWTRWRDCELGWIFSLCRRWIGSTSGGSRSRVALWVRASLDVAHRCWHVGESVQFTGIDTHWFAAFLSGKELELMSAPHLFLRNC